MIFKPSFRMSNTSRKSSSTMLPPALVPNVRKSTGTKTLPSEKPKVVNKKGQSDLERELATLRDVTRLDQQISEQKNKEIEELKKEISDAKEDHSKEILIKESEIQRLTAKLQESTNALKAACKDVKRLDLEATKATVQRDMIGVSLDQVHKEVKDVRKQVKTYLKEIHDANLTIEEQIERTRGVTKLLEKERDKVKLLLKPDAVSEFSSIEKLVLDKLESKKVKIMKRELTEPKLNIKECSRKLVLMISDTVGRIAARSAAAGTMDQSAMVQDIHVTLRNENGKWIASCSEGFGEQSPGKRQRVTEREVEQGTQGRLSVQKDAQDSDMIVPSDDEEDYAWN